MKKRTLFWILALAWASRPSGLPAQQPAARQAGTIITDDVMMLTTAARGLEPLACCPYPAGQTYSIAPGAQCRVDWSAARQYGRDTLRLLQLEIVKGKAPVAQFTLSLKPRAKPMLLQCMKGFGCEGVWEAYPWKSPKGNYLEHTLHLFRVVPVGGAYLRVENLDEKTPITVRVNPCAGPATKSN
ncbi:MAG: hypothetical protein IT260_03365 [Saprospiraceae bacterium]|nr:hypothetical protein [Saprospiraceae bacterium]